VSHFIYVKQAYQLRGACSEMRKDWGKVFQSWAVRILRNVMTQGTLSVAGYNSNQLIYHGRKQSLSSCIESIRPSPSTERSKLMWYESSDVPLAD